MALIESIYNQKKTKHLLGFFLEVKNYYLVSSVLTVALSTVILLSMLATSQAV